MHTLEVNRTIGIIETNKNQAQPYESALKKRGFKTVTYNDAQEPNQHPINSQPDLLIIQETMQDLSPSRLPRVIIGNGYNKAPQRFLNDGALGYISKDALSDKNGLFPTEEGVAEYAAAFVHRIFHKDRDEKAEKVEPIIFEDITVDILRMRVFVGSSILPSLNGGPARVLGYLMEYMDEPISGDRLIEVASANEKIRQNREKMAGNLKTLVNTIRKNLKEYSLHGHIQKSQNATYTFESKPKALQRSTKS